MKKLIENTRNAEGFVLVAALLVMVVLSLIGIAATTNTSIELQIAGNDKVNKKTFYEAEAGAALGVELLEQSFNCVTGFQETDATNGWADLSGTPIRVYTRGGNNVLWNNSLIGTPETVVNDPAQADAAYPVANLDPLGTDADETGYLYFGGETSMQAGGALQMTAGYEGKGKAAGQGGVTKLFDVYSMFRGLVNSETIILFGWSHLVGSEDPSDCAPAWK